MISEFYKKANLKSDFKVSGLCVLAQNLKKNEILFLKNSDAEKVSKIVSDHVDKDMDCFIVTTKTFSGIENYSHIILNHEEFENNKKEMINKFYPEKKLKYVGVTGTNGKTTTSWLLSELARLQSKKPLYIGTVGSYYCGNKVISEFSTTTPSMLDLRRLISSINDDIDLVILEVSSHALEQGRLNEISLEACSWTNLTQDHLDFHKTMSAYFEAKCKIKEMLKDKGEMFFNKSQKSLYDRVDYKFKSISSDLTSYDFNTVDCPIFFKIGYNKENFELALSMYKSLFNSINTQSISLKEINLPAGRFEELAKDNTLFVIDYAHTPDALKKLLHEIKINSNGRNVICVVGCGGNRDALKRPLMAKAASENVFMTILTTDNPRDEDPLLILEDMKSGVVGQFEIICDRKEAIKRSYSIAKKSNAIVVIAGKGHEEYQEVKGVRHFFSDREVVEGL